MTLPAESRPEWLQAAQRLAARKARRIRNDDEIQHMAADGTVSTVSNSQMPVLVTDEDDDIEE